MPSLRGPINVMEIVEDLKRNLEAGKIRQTRAIFHNIYRCVFLLSVGRHFDVMVSCLADVYSSGMCSEDYSCFVTNAFTFLARLHPDIWVKCQETMSEAGRLSRFLALRSE